MGMLSCGLTSGLLQAGLFNPWDRALYLSIKDNRPFLHAENFHKPFSGLSQTIVQRAVSTGLYFPLEELYISSLFKLFPTGENSAATSHKSARSSLLTFAAGILSGITSGVVMNPIAAVKYHYWGTPTGKENFLSTAVDMWRKGGVRTFVVGTGATVNRDLIFGGVYSLMRHELLPATKLQLTGPTSSSSSSSSSSAFTSNPGFFVNLIAACTATIISSPWNYIRNVHYATLRGTPPDGAVTILRGLVHEAAAEGSLFRRLRFLQKRLRIGWGTVSWAHLSCAMHSFAVLLKRLLTRSLYSTPHHTTLHHTGAGRLRHGLWGAILRLLLTERGWQEQQQYMRVKAPQHYSTTGNTPPFYQSFLG